MGFLCVIFVTLIGATVFTHSMSYTDLEQEDEEYSRLISELNKQQQLIKSNVADQGLDIQEVKTLIANQNTDIEKQNVRVADQNTVIQQQNNRITEVGFELKTLIAEQNIEIQKQNVKITEMKCCPPEHSCPNRSESMIEQNSQLIQQQVERQTQINDTVEDLKERLKKITGENQELCPTEFEQHGTSCYKVLGLKTSWIEAKVYCRVLGGYLAIINSEEEQNTVNGILRRFHGRISPEDYWIDGSDMLKEGDWRWMKEHGQSESITYTNWSRGQPDNTKSAEHCLQIRYKYGLKWNDGTCKSEENFICESNIEERG